MQPSPAFVMILKPFLTIWLIYFTVYLKSLELYITPSPSHFAEAFSSTTISTRSAFSSTKDYFTTYQLTSMDHFTKSATRQIPNIVDSFKTILMSHSSSPSSIGGGRPEFGDTIFPMLSRMTDYFYSMVDPGTNRFYYRCLPRRGHLLHGHCPIRDLGSAWDTATLLTFLTNPTDVSGQGVEQQQQQQQPSSFRSTEHGKKTYTRLAAAILATIEAYSGTIHKFEDVHHQPCAALPSKVLEEPSNIAHSAFLILSTVGAMRLSIIESNTSKVTLNDLVNGILYMQQEKSGAFAVHFGSSDITRGIEFYPGEAMLALLDAFQFDSNNDHKQVLSESTRRAIIPAVKKAFLFYTNHYRSGRVSDDYTSFFGNWQVQCFAKLFDVLHEQEMENGISSESSTSAGDETSKSPSDPSNLTSGIVAAYIFELCDAIIASYSWQTLIQRRYNNLSTVEIACGLEAIAEGIHVALKQATSSSSPSSKKACYDRINRYLHYEEAAVSFLHAIQNQVPSGATAGSGGLGHAMHLLEQRLDVTGHAVNALVKVYGNVQQISQLTSSIGAG